MYNNSSTPSNNIPNSQLHSQQKTGSQKIETKVKTPVVNLWFAAAKEMALWSWRLSLKSEPTHSNYSQADPFLGLKLGNAKAAL